MPNKDLINLQLSLIHSVLEFLYLLAENISIIKEILGEFTVEQDVPKLAY